MRNTTNSGIPTRSNSQVARYDPRAGLLNFFLNKSYQYLTLFKKGVYLLEITITQKMQTLNTLLLTIGAEGRDTTWTEMV